MQTPEIQELRGRLDAIALQCRKVGLNDSGELQRCLAANQRCDSLLPSTLLSRVPAALRQSLELLVISESRQVCRRLLRKKPWTKRRRLAHRRLDPDQARAKRRCL